MKFVKDTKNYHIEIEGERGYFEHDEEGMDRGGGLWFEGKELIDYDGVYSLPKQVYLALKEAGYDMSWVEGDYASTD